MVVFSETALRNEEKPMSSYRGHLKSEQDTVPIATGFHKDEREALEAYVIQVGWPIADILRGSVAGSSRHGTGLRFVDCFGLVDPLRCLCPRRDPGCLGESGRRIPQGEEPSGSPARAAQSASVPRTDEPQVSRPEHRPRCPAATGMRR